MTQFVEEVTYCCSRMSLIRRRHQAVSWPLAFRKAVKAAVLLICLLLVFDAQSLLPLNLVSGMIWWVVQLE